MLHEMRSMKTGHARRNIPVSTISQGRVWNHVAGETAMENSVSDKTQYTQAVRARHKRAKEHSAKLKFPKHTIGVIVIDPEGNVKGLEIHRSPRNFDIRKDGILESLETNLSWEKTGKGPFPHPEDKVKTLFKNLSEMKEGKDALKQVEVDGVVLNIAGIAGEVLTSKFYSASCPKCGAQKPRKKDCPQCGFEEAVSDELAFMSMA